MPVSDDCVVPKEAVAEDEMVEERVLVSAGIPLVDDAEMAVVDDVEAEVKIGPCVSIEYDDNITT